MVSIIFHILLNIFYLLIVLKQINLFPYVYVFDQEIKMSSSSYVSKNSYTYEF